MLFVMVNIANLVGGPLRLNLTIILYSLLAFVALFPGIYLSIATLSLAIKKVSLTRGSWTLSSLAYETTLRFFNVELYNACHVSQNPKRQKA